MLKRGTLLNLTDFYLFLQHFEVWISQWRATSPILHIKVSSHVTTGAARFVETVLLCLQWVRRSSHKSVNTAKQCCISSDEETTHVLCSYIEKYHTSVWKRTVNVGIIQIWKAILSLCVWSRGVKSVLVGVGAPTSSSLAPTTPCFKFGIRFDWNDSPVRFHDRQTKGENNSS